MNELGQILRDPITELEAYLTGELEAWMGIRSSMGSLIDWKGPPPQDSSPRAIEPTEAAMFAARAMRRVETVGRAIPEQHMRALIARYRSRGPEAPLGLRAHFGPLASVVEWLGPPELVAGMRDMLAADKRTRPAKQILKGARDRAALALERAETTYRAKHGELYGFGGPPRGGTRATNGHPYRTPPPGFGRIRDAA